MKTVTPRTVWPAALLFFLSPTVGELLSGSSPPVEFFTVFGLTVMTALYGCGALLVREISRRWGGGWGTRALLGAAFGIVEEGLMVKSFFDPAWPDLGPLGVHGRWAGVNWVWAVDLTVYHAFYSMCIPILLTELLFPRARDRPWVRGPGLVALGSVLAADVVFGFLALTSYRPPAVAWLGAAVAAAAMGMTAWGLGRRGALRAPLVVTDARARPIVYFLVGLGAAVLFFFLIWVVPGIRLPWLVTLALMPVYLVGLYLVLRGLSRPAPPDPARAWALAAGALALFVFLGPVAARDLKRTDDPRGMDVVGLVSGVMLGVGYGKVRRDATRESGESGAPKG